MTPKTFVWSGGEHPFFLRIAEFRALQQACDAGPAWVMGRLASQQWRVEDVVETIRLGLIGGGMPQAEAMHLVERHVEQATGGLYVNAILALNILRVSLVGDEDDEVGEPEAGNQMEMDFPAESYDGQSSSTPE